MDNKTTITWPGWEIVRIIGRGSFGVVYEIQRDIFGDVEKAALKHIPIPSSEEEIANFRNVGMDQARIRENFRSQLNDIVKEYKLMRRLNDCPYVVGCDDMRYTERADGFGWDVLLKMELLTPLTKMLRAQKEIPEETVIALGIDISRALIPCAQYHILHRDIKVQNIFVSKDGKYKLGDFGIAKAKEKTGTDTARIGTYDYMAPEVYFGRHYDRTADIYSLGIVLYWLLNNRRMPFMPQAKELPRLQEREAARMRRLKGEPIPPPVNGSEELKRIVMKCCACQPEDRYQDAGQLLADLTDTQRALLTPDEPSTEDGSPEGGTVEEPRELPALFIRAATKEAFPITRDVTVLGRKAELVNLVITENHAVSREHAAIVRRGSQYLLHNLRPKSGTEVNGIPLAWDADAELEACSEITLADEQFFFAFGDAYERVRKEGKLCLLRCEKTGEIKALCGDKLELDRSHPWQNGILTDRHISRAKQAEIVYMQGKLFLRDLDSPNGTSLNGMRLKPHENFELHDGDVISVAETDFVYMEISIDLQRHI